MVPEIWCVTDGWADGWMERDKEVGAPPKSKESLCGLLGYNLSGLVIPLMKFLCGGTSWTLDPYNSMKIQKMHHLYLNLS